MKKKSLIISLGLVLVLAISGGVWFYRLANRPMPRPPFRLPFNLKPSFSQLNALYKLQDEYRPALEGVNQVKSSILNKDYFKAREELIKKAIAQGKKGKDLQQVIANAEETIMTPENHKLFTETIKKRTEIDNEIRTKIKALLTDAQTNEMQTIITAHKAQYEARREQMKRTPNPTPNPNPNREPHRPFPPKK